MPVVALRFMTACWCVAAATSPAWDRIPLQAPLALAPLALAPLAPAPLAPGPLALAPLERPPDQLGLSARWTQTRPRPLLLLSLLFTIKSEQFKATPPASPCDTRWRYRSSLAEHAASWARTVLNATLTRASTSVGFQFLFQRRLL